MARKTKQGASRDEPLGRVVLIPLDRVTVVHRELVMEVVVALSDGDECGDDVVARRVLVVKRSVTEVVRQRVDTERGLQIEKSVYSIETSRK